MNLTKFEFHKVINKCVFKGTLYSLMPNTISCVERVKMCEIQDLYVAGVIVFFMFLFIVKTENCRIKSQMKFLWKRPLDYLVLTPHSKQDQTTPGLFQGRFDYCQGWRFHHLWTTCPSISAPLWCLFDYIFLLLVLNCRFFQLLLTCHLMRPLFW